MGHIAIRLNPGLLVNPDLDLRYRIPDLIEETTAGATEDNGYDYAGEDDDTLIVFLRCDSPDREVQTVIEALRKQEICGNWLLDSAVIGISEDAESFEIVYPPDQTGQFTVRPW